MSHRYRTVFFSLSILLLSGLLVGFQPSSAQAQLQVQTDIQLSRGDGKLSTTTSVSGTAGSTVVVEVFATGYTNAQGVEVFLDVPDISAIDTTPTGKPSGASAVFPVVINSVIGNQMQMSAVVFGAPLSYSGEPKLVATMTFKLSSTFKSTTVTVTKVDFGGGSSVQPKTVFTIAPPSNNLISGVTVTPKHNGATIAWATIFTGKTDVVQYRKKGDTAYLSVDSTLTTESQKHSVVITGLTAATTYEYIISSTSTSGELSPSTTRTFTTRSTPDTTPLQISSFNYTATNKEATFTWATNRLADTRIKITSGSTTISEKQADANGTTGHSITITGLTAGTTYNATITSRGVGLDDLVTDKLMTEAEITATKTQEFKTKLGAKPLSFNGTPTALASTTDATITVRLNQPAAVIVEYGGTNFDGTYVIYTDSVSSSTNSDVHVFTLPQLTNATTYGYRVTATIDPAKAGQKPQRRWWTNSITDGELIQTKLDSTITTDTYLYSSFFLSILNSGTPPATFTTKKVLGPIPKVVTGPQVETNKISPLYSKGILTFTTNVNASAVVYIGTVGQGGTLGTPDEIQLSRYILYYLKTYDKNHTFNLISLTPGAKYGYRIELTDADGQTGLYDPHNSKSGKPTLFQVAGSDGSFTASETPDTTPPIITRGPTVVSSTPNSLIIEFDTNEFATSTVDYGLSATALDQQEIDGTPATTHRITLTGLTAGTAYSYRIGVTDIVENGPIQSQVGLATTPTQPDLVAPNFSVAPALSYASNTRAEIKWTTNEISTAEIAYGTSATALDQVLTFNDFASAQTAILTDLTAGTTYHYQVSVRDYTGNGPTRSQVLTFQTKATADTQAPVVSAVTVSPTDSAAVVTWTTDEVSNSIVLVGLSSTALNNNISKIDLVTSHKLVVANLLPGTTYSYQVQSFDPAGNGSVKTTAATFTTLAAGASSAPAAPEGLTARAGNATVQLTWSAPASTATALILERAIGDSSFAPIATLDPVTAFIDRSVTNGTAYRYRLRATGLFQRTGDPSAATTAVTPSTAGGPSAPSLFSIQGNQTTPTIVVKNSTPIAQTDVLTYTFALSTQADFSVILRNVTVPSGNGLGASDPTGHTAYTFADSLTDGSTYYYRVSANDGFSDGAALSGSFKVNAKAPAYPGDFNGDLVVGFVDFLTFSGAFGKLTGQTGFVAAADLNGDGNIGFPDFLTFVSYFNKTYIKGPASGKPIVATEFGTNATAKFALLGHSRPSNVGNELVVNVNLMDVTNLQGYGLEIAYDPKAFEFIKASDQGNTFLKTGDRKAELFAVLDHKAETGQVFLGNAITQGSAVSGQGQLLTLYFKILDPKSQLGDIRIAQGILFDADRNGFVVQHLGDRFSLIPTEYALEHNFPNPFNPETTLRYAIPEAGQVSLIIYNILGQEVVRLVDSNQTPGFYTVQWNGQDALGRSVASGVYLYRLQAEGFSKTHKMLLLK